MGPVFTADMMAVTCELSSHTARTPAALGDSCDGSLRSPPCRQHQGPLFLW